jgi:RND family efflux transporter MFP subunit
MYKAIFLLVPVLALSACGDAPVPEDAAIPRVKLYTVGQADNDRTRRFSGSVVASEEAPLSFALSGTVQEVRVARGNVVRQGQLLASLDSAPTRTALDSARAQLVSARAGLTDAKSTYERYSSLQSRGAVSRADLETATSNYASARSSVSTAQAEIERLERDMANTNLVAPFDGTVAERSIEPFQEVTPGQSAFVLQTTESLEVDVQIPENMIGEIDYADVVNVSFPAFDGLSAKGSVQTIGSRAESGNSFPVTVRLHGVAPDVRPGMTAGVTFILSSQQQGGAIYLIPVAAIAIDVGVNAATGDGDLRTAPVFIFDEASGQLQVRQVRIGDIRGNYLEVVDGLREGDRVVSAGVPFLREGQTVEEWRPEQGLDNG